MKQRTLHWNDLLQETDLIILCHAPPILACRYIILFIEPTINGICSVFQIFMLWTPCFTRILPKIMKQRRLHRNDLLQETDLIISCDAPPGLACQYIIIFIKQSINGICNVFHIYTLWTPCFTLILPKIMKQRTLLWNCLLQETDLIILCHAPSILECRYIILFSRKEEQCVLYLPHLC